MEEHVNMAPDEVLHFHRRIWVNVERLISHGGLFSLWNGIGRRPVTGPLKTAFERVDIPFQKSPSKAELQARLKNRDSDIRTQAERMLRVIERQGNLPDHYPDPVQVWQFGRSLKFIALGGEVVVDYSLRLKARYGWEDTWVAAYCNDVFAYVPSARVLQEGGYEARGGDGGPFTAVTEEIIVEKVHELVRRTSP